MKRDNSVTSAPASRSQKDLNLLSEAECKLLLARIAGQLGISDARNLPYTSALTGRR